MNNKSAAAPTSIPRFALHLGRGIRRMENKKDRRREMRALPCVYPFLFRAAHCYTKKTADPAAPVSAKSAISSARSGVRTLDTLIKSQVLCQLS